MILSGVVGAKSGVGEVRISALKQYGLLEGDSSGYTASPLAKKIEASPPDELQELYKQAALHPSVFKSLFDTFHGDAVTKAKLKQRAADLNVHPEETERCVDLYISAMTAAGLVSEDNDKLTHVSSASLANKARASGAEASDGETVSEGERLPQENVADDANPNSDDQATGAPRAIFHVNVTLDSSLDTDKLARQLQLLKRFGAI